MPCGLFYKLRGPDGEEFIDRIIKGWLSADGKDHPDGEPLHLSLTPAPQLLLDEEQPLVAKLHCVPRATRGPSFVSLWQAPEQWVFFRVTPSGNEEEKRFFEFPDLDARADGFLAGSGAKIEGG